MDFLRLPDQAPPTILLGRTLTPVPSEAFDAVQTAAATQPRIAALVARKQSLETEAIPRLLTQIAPFRQTLLRAQPVPRRVQNQIDQVNRLVDEALQIEAELVRAANVQPLARATVRQPQRAAQQPPATLFATSAKQRQEQQRQQAARAAAQAGAARPLFIPGLQGGPQGAQQTSPGFGPTSQGSGQTSQGALQSQPDVPVVFLPSAGAASAASDSVARLTQRADALRNVEIPQLRDLTRRSAVQAERGAPVALGATRGAFQQALDNAVAELRNIEQQLAALTASPAASPVAPLQPPPPSSNFADAAGTLTSTGAAAATPLLPTANRAPSAPTSVATNSGDTTTATPGTQATNSNSGPSQAAVQRFAQLEERAQTLASQESSLTAEIADLTERRNQRFAEQQALEASGQRSVGGRSFVRGTELQDAAIRARQFELFAVQAELQEIRAILAERRANPAMSQVPALSRGPLAGPAVLADQDVSSVMASSMSQTEMIWTIVGSIVIALLAIAVITLAVLLAQERKRSADASARSSLSYRDSTPEQTAQLSPEQIAQLSSLLK